MADLALLESLGIFVRKDFLSESFSRGYLAEVESRQGQYASLRRNGAVVTDRAQRKTKHLPVSAATRSVIELKLQALKPDLEAHFGVKLGGLTSPMFYRYEVGDFFGVHRDVDPNSPAPSEERQRCISLIVFVNGFADSPSQTDSQTAFGGGELTFYGLLKDSRWANYGFSLKPESASMIAFPSEMLHEVKPVVFGRRYTIVSWFASKEG